jgi:hypothetical protein
VYAGESLFEFSEGLRLQDSAMVLLDENSLEIGSFDSFDNSSIVARSRGSIVILPGQSIAEAMSVVDGGVIVTNPEFGMFTTSTNGSTSLTFKVSGGILEATAVEQNNIIARDLYVGANTARPGVSTGSVYVQGDAYVVGEISQNNSPVLNRQDLLDSYFRDPNTYSNVGHVHSQYVVFDSALGHSHAVEYVEKDNGSDVFEATQGAIFSDLKWKYLYSTQTDITSNFNPADKNFDKTIYTTNSGDGQGRIFTNNAMGDCLEGSIVTAIDIQDIGGNNAALEITCTYLR